jgi:hypothetical protein
MKIALLAIVPALFINVACGGSNPEPETPASESAATTETKPAEEAAPSDAKPAEEAAPADAPAEPAK